MRPPHSWLLAALLVLVAAPQCPSRGAAPLLEARVHTPEASVWARFETRGTLALAGQNPFDPAQVELTGEFRAPDGRALRMPGFLHQEFDRALVGGFEKLRPRGAPFWAVRFAPDAPGEWTWRWVARVGGETRDTPWRAFEVRPPAPGDHGLLRPSPLDPRYLRFDDGTPYVAIGENLCWYDGRGTFAYDDWIGKLASAGATWTRLWMPSWAFGLEWIRRAPDGSVASSSLGDYTARLDRAWQLDHVVERLGAAGIQVQLSLQNHGPFSLEHNSEWADNPYNAANGGPLADPADFFTDPTARGLFRRRLRYVVARWGWATHLHAWELWNEVNLVPGGQGAGSIAWHAEMAAVLRDLDPYDRTVTSSVSFPAPSPITAHPDNGLTQIHLYAWPILVDVASGLAQAVASVERPGVPTLVAEFGVDYRGPAETRANDPEAVGFHDALWGPLLSGAAGTAMSWWWDNVIDPDDLYFHLAAVADFVEGVAFDEYGFVAGRPAVAAPGRTLDAYALDGAGLRLVWIKNRDHQWLPPGTGLDPGEVAGGVLALPGLAPGVWRARWFDTTTGDVFRTEDVAAGPSGLDLAIPVFARDVALRLERVPVP